MEWKTAPIFDGAHIPYFSVPQALVGDKDASLLRSLSYPALRVYLVILSKAGRDNRPYIKVDNNYFVKIAGVGKNQIAVARKELVDAGLITASRAGAKFCYELRNPATGAELSRTKIHRHTFRSPTAEEANKIFQFYGLESFALPKGKIICPFHSPSDVDGAGKKGRYYRIRISSTSSGILWNCSFPRCRHFGKMDHRVVVDEETWADKIVISGGGDVIHMIAAMEQLQGRTAIKREGAIKIAEQILGAKLVDYDPENQLCEQEV
ncbi:MAG: hypothetical protein P4K83_12435 [Terracidiphilus sp.]|nr:hypothetical protein [Terracidiphilus sp.]